MCSPDVTFGCASIRCERWGPTSLYVGARLSPVRSGHPLSQVMEFQKIRQSVLSMHAGKAHSGGSPKQHAASRRHGDGELGRGEGTQVCDTLTFSEEKDACCWGVTNIYI